MAKVGAVILAAGRSSRFAAAGGEGPSKLIAPLFGKPLVRHPVEAALASTARPVVVVTGHAKSDLEAALKGLPLQFVFNADFLSGMASSLRAGVAALPGDVDGAIVMLGDMPGVKSAVLDRLIEKYSAAPSALAVVPVQAGRRGNPVLLARTLFAEVAQITGDEGARRLLASARAGQILEASTDEIGVNLDVDTPEALAAAEAAFRLKI
jgi:molybdenum cofactor cytidylyltransferase